MKPAYKHQCRYCAHCVCGDAWWCDLKSEYCHNPKRSNKCAEFLFNEIPADDCSGNRVYKPRKKRISQFVQPKLFDVPTDKQRKERTMASKNEKIADIVREMRVYAKKSKINGGDV